MWPNGTWCCLGSCGTVAVGPQPGAADAVTRWFELGVTVRIGAISGQREMTATIGGKTVAAGRVGGGGGGTNPYLTASYSTATGNGLSTLWVRPGEAAPAAPQSNAEFRRLRLNMSAQLPHAAPKPSPPSPPHPPAPPPDPARAGLGLAECNVANPPPVQLWSFSGVDGGAAGTLRPSSNASACLDATASSASPSRPTAPTNLATCVPGSASQQWPADRDG